MQVGPGDGLADDGLAKAGIMRRLRGGFAARPPPSCRHAHGAGAAAHAAAHAAALADATPELDCLRGRLPMAVLTAAAARAAAIGVSAERVLIARGTITEDDYVAALAAHLGLAVETFAAVPRSCCPLADDRLIETVAAGILPLRDADGLVFVAAPHNARHLLGFVARCPSAPMRLRLTTRRHLERYIVAEAGGALGERAANLLARTWPALSAAPRPIRHPAPRQGRWRAPARIALGVAAGAALLALSPLRLAAELLLAAVFIAWIVFRLVGIALAPATPRRRPALPADRDLPTYTVIVALYREAASAARLVRALEELDYPREKLEVKIVLEPDDAETLAALQRLPLRPEFSLVVAPAIGPRTKPKALNVALPLAAGDMIAVYDAEDRPEPDQLRKAAAAFAAGGRDLACVQARLTIDNTADSWLAGFFTADYAAQFGLLLPALAALEAPLPLGGTSNHFRAAALRRIGGWDSYNVTEDADLGLRLARFGYRAGVIDSATDEEAPARIGPWMRQRTRWFKGWMQTWRVHMRRPLRLWRELGPLGFVTVQLTAGGNVLAALIHPVFVAAVIYALARGSGVFEDGDGAAPVTAAVFGVSAVAGYLASIVLGAIGLIRQGLPATAWVLLLTPLYWLLLSCAAWRAVIETVRAPYRWNKTEHGLAQTSRQGRRALRALARLERHLTLELAVARLRRRVAAPPRRPLRDSSAIRRPPPRASASGQTGARSGRPYP